jgi:hypothetical protein
MIMRAAACEQVDFRIFMQLYGRRHSAKNMRMSHEGLE